MRILRKLFLLKLLFLILFTPSLLRAQSSSIDAFAVAIAKAEGYYLKGSIPNRYRNPGDIKVRAGQKYFGQVRIGKGGHIVFRNDAAGWFALREQLRKIVEGESRFYTPQMTLRHVAQKYAGNYRVWAKNVSHDLGVNPNTTIAELFGIPPQFDPRWVGAR